MDLLQTVRKTGSRGGVNFSWDEVAASSHRENYLGHSLKAPVGRWQKGRDLNWYAKADDDAGPGGSSIETGEERAAREKKEELRKIKQAEEEAIARELGLPPPQGNTSGANSTAVGKQRSIGNSALGELPPLPPFHGTTWTEERGAGAEAGAAKADEGVMMTMTSTGDIITGTAVVTDTESEAEKGTELVMKDEDTIAVRDMDAAQETDEAMEGMDTAPETAEQASIDTMKDDIS
ncbi:Kinase phosphorylation domain protein [Moelleriella libera RCEF 2490]|uniref:Kinase phosphorylation domain protein n=1 Tax=Moelleriella libera RCEF 2490 TaxID=1081109 RepID=A0A168E587_9HYPO|nr:Kinase phosphorylation domain protein [Moelleriella libera RCEF 2490]